MLYGALLVAELALVVYCVISIISTPAGQARVLPKLLWLVLVVLFPLLGGGSWLLFGRPRGQALPGAAKGPAAPRGPLPGAGPDDDEAFLRGLRQRAEEQRRNARDDGSEPTA